MQPQRHAVLNTRRKHRQRAIREVARSTTLPRRQVQGAAWTHNRANICHMNPNLQSLTLAFQDGDCIIGVSNVRIVDGKGAVTFLVRVKDALEDPRRLLMDL